MFANEMPRLFIFSVLFAEAAGKIAREEGKPDLGSSAEDGFPDCLSAPPTSAELASNPHSSRSEHSRTDYHVELWDSTMFVLHLITLSTSLLWH